MEGQALRTAQQVLEAGLEPELFQHCVGGQGVYQQAFTKSNMSMIGSLKLTSDYSQYMAVRILILGGVCLCLAPWTLASSRCGEQN